MNDSFLVRVLNRVANPYEKFEPLPNRELLPVAIIGNAKTFHIFHDEERPSGFRRPTIKDFGDVRMIHQRQGLPFSFKPRDHRPGIHSQLDDLKSDAAVDRFLLVRQINYSATAFADRLQKSIVPDLLTSIPDQAGSFPLLLNNRLIVRQRVAMGSQPKE